MKPSESNRLAGAVTMLEGRRSVDETLVAVPAHLVEHRGNQYCEQCSREAREWWCRAKIQFVAPSERTVS